MPNTTTSTTPARAKNARKRRFARTPATETPAPAAEGAPEQAAEETPTQAAEQTAATADPTPEPKRPTKISDVIALLQREQGATLAELIDATGWLPHTTRAALTGLKKKGHTLEKSKRDEVTCYRIVEQA